MDDKEIKIIRERCDEATSGPWISFVEERDPQRARMEAFEKMLHDIQEQARYEQTEMDRLKAAGREKSATYRQFFGNRMFYRMMMDKYREYGLLD